MDLPSQMDGRGESKTERGRETQETVGEQAKARVMGEVSDSIFRGGGGASLRYDIPRGRPLVLLKTVTM